MNYETYALSAILAILGYLLKNKIENMATEIENLKHKNEEINAEMIEFKDNYLDRFEKLNRNISESRVEILNKFHEIQINLINKINEKN